MNAPKSGINIYYCLSQESIYPYICESGINIVLVKVRNQYRKLLDKSGINIPIFLKESGINIALPPNVRNQYRKIHKKVRNQYTQNITVRNQYKIKLFLEEKPSTAKIYGFQKLKIRERLFPNRYSVVLDYSTNLLTNFSFPIVTL